MVLSLVQWIISCILFRLVKTVLAILDEPVYAWASDLIYLRAGSVEEGYGSPLVEYEYKCVIQLPIALGQAVVKSNVTLKFKPLFNSTNLLSCMM